MSKNLNINLRELAYIDHLQFLQKLRNEKSLNIDDLEIILTRALLDIKVEKEANKSAEIINLTYRVQQLEEEKKKLLQEHAMEVKDKEE